MNALKIEFTKFIIFFNSTLEKYNSKIPRLRYITSGKKRQMQRIVNEAKDKKVLQGAVEIMAQSDFLNGRIITPKLPNGFIASFDWMLGTNERIFELINGKYNNTPEHEPSAEELRKKKAEEQTAREARNREEARRIEEEEHERREREREEARANAATPEQLEKIWATIGLPPLRENEKLPRQRFFA